MEPSAPERAFAAEVERHRAAARVTQDWVAQRVGLSRAKVSEVCGGRYLPSRQVLDALVVALAMDRERAVRLWKAAWEARERRRRAERANRQDAPDDWSSLPVLPDEVRSLLRAQEVAARDLPYRLPGARTPSLDTVYVRQELGTGTEDAHDEQPRTEPELDERGLLRERAAPKPRLTVRPPARTVRQALDDDEHVLVTGGPGQGKSTLSLRLAGEIAARWSGRDGSPPLAEPVVPLRLTARELAKRLDLPFPKALVESIAADYGSLLWSEVDPTRVAERVAGCRWLLLVDGLDEVADPVGQSRLLHVLEGCAAPGSPYRVVVTTRPIEGSILAPLQRASAARYELQPFDERALRRFADNWFDGSPGRADRFLRQLRAAHLDELARVPLLVTIAAIIFERFGDRPLPDNQYELYEAYLGYLLTAHPTAPGPFDHLRDDLLQHLGRVRLESDTSLVTAARTWVAERLPVRVGWTEELTTFLTAVGPLVQRGDDLRFLHHSFAEHLAATARARELPASFTAGHHDFTSLLHTASQGEPGRHARAVLLHYTRLRPDQADHVLRSLHGGGASHHVLAAKLLAQHLPAGPEVVDDFLATARAWAMTTDYLGAEVLRHASRAAHHPALVSWLLDLMRDDRAPWESRVEAATALATRLRTAHTPEAVALLCAVADDPSTAVPDRLAAAEALSQCGASERNAAERGLRAVLADPHAEMSDCRTAAVVLASLSVEGREGATKALLDLLDDPLMPNDDLVEIATGLVEIGVEFHDRCAEVFLSVLRDPVGSMTGRRDAAIALASLGAHHLDQAATALVELVGQRWRHRVERANAAKTLAELGPEHRATAAAHLQDMMAEHQPEHSDRRTILEALIDLGGCSPHAAAVHLRKTIDDHQADVNAVYWAVRTLADFGPEYHDEAARHLLRIADDPLVTGFEREAALGRLGEFGEPHRTNAINRLRHDLTDPGTDPGRRCDAGRELSRLGPEFHGEVVENLLDILSHVLRPYDASRAWQLLASLDTRYKEAAARAQFELLTPATEEDAYLSSYFSPVPIKAEDSDQAAETLLRALSDTTLSWMVRHQACTSLIRLHRRFHQPLLGVFLELWETDRLLSSARYFTRTAPQVRARLAKHIQEVIGATTDAEVVISGAEALAALGHHDDSTASLVRGVVLDHVVAPTTRFKAATSLALLDPHRIAEMIDFAADTMLHPSPWSWKFTMSQLARLGGDITAHVATQVDRDVDCDMKREAAALVMELRGEPDHEAVSALRQLADDAHLASDKRGDAFMTLARFEPTATDAVNHLESVVNDEDASTDERGGAAYDLVRLDRSHWHRCVVVLQRMLVDPMVTLEEHVGLVQRLSRLNALRQAEINKLNFAVVHHPSASTTTRRDALNRVADRTRDAIFEELVTDRATPVGVRLPRYPSPALTDVVTTAARDVMTAIESTRADRVDAAVALVDASHQVVPEALGTLTHLASDSSLRFRAWRALADCGTPYRREAVARALDVVGDEAESLHARFRAANLIIGLLRLPPAGVVDFLRRVASDERTSSWRRLESLFRLRHVDGLDGVRAMRDDERVSPVVRRLAATKLVDYRPEDRATGAELLRKIAADTSQRPALRCAAASDLVRFGAPGRAHAAEIAHAMAVDTALSPTCRVRAAEILEKAARSRRREALAILGELSAAADPRHRLRALEAVAAITPLTATHPLRAMTRDRDLPPVVRLRSAEALVANHREHREPAVIAAREVAFDERLPKHVRVRAARNLARWSEVFRDVARQLLHALLER
ncbi:helix-turn-helix domain-containing protein [Saccharothrix sp. S26]|uniref:XRE family transcriptional regulator n=1 Tax=Saccharothrix sp. S26 TaxID=2907215 RepID=UPI001F3D42B7|nr:XRE family transcriptional regulator [Saccharothrix sp. S26]MCE6995220.1 helix-turn-helix domain-containing protein [Saccharothrix sp. S26]